MCWAKRFSAKQNPKAWTEIPRLLYYIPIQPQIKSFVINDEKLFSQTIVPLLLVSNWATKFSAIQFQQNDTTKTCISPKLKSHWNKNKKCSYCPSFSPFFFFFFPFSDHIFWFFFLFFFYFFNSHSFFRFFFQQSLVFQSLICSLIYLFFKSQVNCSLCLLHFCLPSTSVLITSNFISPSLVISVIN